MRQLLLASVLSSIVAVGAPPAAAQPSSSSSSSSSRSSSYSGEARVAYVTRALAAMTSLGPAALRLEHALSDAARKRCASRGDQPPRLPCLLDLAQKTCASSAAEYGGAETCAAAADVILVNLRSAVDLLDEATRVRLVRSSTDYHAAALAALRLRYAALAAELVIADPDASAGPPGVAASAPSIDRFCAGRDYRPEPPRCNQPSPTCVPSLSWQRCAAALVWLVTTPPSPAKETTP
jgi:hypothetical protein